MKLAVIFHRFGPYHCARLKAASRSNQVIGIELGSETSEYNWSKIQETAFERITLFPESDSRSKPLAELASAMRDAFSVCKPEAVAIPGWSEKGALVALGWSLENSVPAILMSESSEIDEPRTSWREFAKRRIVALCSAGLVGGERHKDYLVKLGMAPDRVFLGYDAVDNAYFAQGAKEVGGLRAEDGGRRSEYGEERREENAERPTPNAQSRINEQRRRYQLPENYFLASARFIPKKNLDTLIRAYSEYRQRAEIGGQRPEVGGQNSGSSLVTRHSSLWSLVILGDGPLKSDLCSLISDLRLQDFVLLPGFKQYDELPTYYAMANAFVHASSSEQWGLVVNEAMASGLPVMVSNRCGCAPELVREGVNGFTFDPDNQAELTARLLAMASVPCEERARMGEIGQQIIKDFGPERFGEGLENAARLAVSSPRKKRLGIIDRLILRRLLSR